MIYSFQQPTVRDMKTQNYRGRSKRDNEFHRWAMKCHAIHKGRSRSGNKTNAVTVKGVERVHPIVWNSRYLAAIIYLMRYA